MFNAYTNGYRPADISRSRLKLEKGHTLPFPWHNLAAP